MPSGESALTVTSAGPSMLNESLFVDTLSRYAVTGSPLSLAGACHCANRDPPFGALPSVAVTLGASGGADGRPVPISDSADVPLLFVAWTLKE